MYTKILSTVFLFVTTVSFGQIAIDNTQPVKVTDSTVTKTVTKTVSGKVTTTSTKVITKDDHQKINKTSITVETVTLVTPKLADDTDGTETATIHTEIQVTDSGTLIPEIVTDSATYRNSKIKILKSEVVDYRYQITYFDLDDTKKNPKLKMYKNTVKANEYVSNLQKGFGVYRPHILTVPFKIRPKTGGEPQIAKADIDNVGVLVPFYQRKSERLFPNGSTSTHRWSAGVHFCPMVETYNAKNTEPDITEEVTNLGISLGFAITYTYNDITFAVIPLGVDFGFTSEARDWIYQGKHWYGFGLGLDINILDVVKGE